MQKPQKPKPKCQAKTKTVDLRKVYGLLIMSYLQAQGLAKTSSPQKKTGASKLLEKAA